MGRGDVLEIVVGDAKMKRAFIVFQWLVTAALLVLFVWGVLQPPPPPRYNPTLWRNWDGFSVVSYSGVPRDSYGRYVNKERLAEHFAALKAAGFNTIRPEDAREFLAGRAPLPAKALMILFEGGRKDSFIAATPLLRKNGFIATYGVPSGLTEKWGSFYVRKADIGKLADMEHWSLASMGHAAIHPIPVDDAGSRKGFLTHRKWLDDRAESDDELRARITNDYARAAALITREAGAPPVAFIAPYQPGGPWRAVEEDALVANGIGLEFHSGIAFMRNEGSFNGPGTNPRDLTRFNAGGEISGAELVMRLNAALPRSAAVEGVGDPANDWFTIGPARAMAGKIIASTGGRAWLQGTSGWSDFEVNTKVRRWTTNVLAAVYVRYTSPGSYVRVAIASDVIRVQERIGTRMQTLAQHTVTDPARIEHTLKFLVKGNRAWVTVDGELIGGNPVPLTFATARGATGLSSDRGNTELTDFSARPISAVYAFATHEAVPHLGADVVAYMPSWFQAGVRTRFLSEVSRADALIAGARGIETIPVVLNVTNVAGDAATALGRMIASTLSPPATKTLIRTIALRGANLETAAQLEALDYKVLFILTPPEAVKLADEQPTAFFNRSVLLDCAEDALIHLAVRHLLRVCSTDRIVVCGDVQPPLPRGIGTARQFIPEAKP